MLPFELFPIMLLSICIWYDNNLITIPIVNDIYIANGVYIYIFTYIYNGIYTAYFSI